MLFPSKAITEARGHLFDRVQAGEITQVEMFQKALELYADDALALDQLGRYEASQGNLEAAERYCWRAVEADPVLNQPWMTLHYITGQRQADQALQIGVLELGARKTLRDPAAMEVFEKNAELPTVPGATPRDYLEAAAYGLDELRGEEPEEVANQLEPFRLVDELIETAEGGLDQELMDAIVNAGSRCVPVLVGVLRAFANNRMDDHPDALVASAALLGEIGDLQAVPPLVECLALDQYEGLAEAARWSFARIARRQHEETFHIIQELAAGAPAKLRVALALALNDVPHRGRTELLVSLLDGLEQMEKSERYKLFIAVIESLLAMEEKRGWEMAQSLLHRYAALLPKRARNDLQSARKMVAALRSMKDEEEFEVPETLADFCSGSSQAEDEEPFDEEEDKPEMRSAPLQRPTPARNDPCWCGSGKKYKKCHREADEQARRESGGGGQAAGPARTAEDALRERVLQFALENLRKAEARHVMELFAGPDADELADDEVVMFADWLIHDYVLPRLGRTMLEEFLRRPPGGITSEQRHLLEGWSQSRYSLLEALEVHPGSGVTVKDLLTGDEFFAHDISTSKRASRWDCWLARYERAGDGFQFCGVMRMVPRAMVEELRAWALEAKRESGLDWDAFLRAHGNQLRLKAQAMQPAGLPRIVSNEGDPLTFSHAVYKVAERVEAQRALDSCEALERDDQESPDVYHWMEPEESEGGGRRILGSLRFKGDRLTLECMTRERLERGKRLLQDVAGGVLRHQADQLQGVESAMRAQAGKPKTPSSIPPEVEKELVRRFMDDHYHKWLDMQLPALDGKSPREAAALPDYHDKLAGLLKMLENGEERNRHDGRPWYDVTWLKDELGVKF